MTTLHTLRPSRRGMLKAAGAAVIGFHLPAGGALAQAQPAVQTPEINAWW